MSQHDLTIDNQGFPAFRADLNNALQALGSTQSGTSAPSPTFANQLWYDTTNNQLKIRNEDNDAWITVATLDQTNDVLSAIALNTINEGTSAAGVTIDGVLIKDNSVTATSDSLISGLTVGKGAGAVSTNTAFGASALGANTSGSVNTAIGNGALDANTTGLQNTAVGNMAVSSITTGNNNTGVGHRALEASTGNDNTAIGSAALQSNTSGASNVAMGQAALLNNTSASSSTAIGYQAGYSFASTGNSPITAFGAQAAYTLNAADPRVTAIGYQALYTNNGGGTYENTAVGWGAAKLTTTGSGLVALGNESLALNTTGSSNVAIGYQALTSNTTASQNTALGFQAGKVITTASESTYVGYQAGVASTGNAVTLLGRMAGRDLTTGTNNTFVGHNSGLNMTTGSKNTILGSYNGNQGGVDIRTSSNNIVISNGNGDIRARWDSSSNCFLYMGTGAGTNTLKINSTTREVTYDVSSARYKNNIRDSIYGLNHVMKLRSAMFEYKKEKTTDIGFIAEEFVKVIPELVTIDQQGRPDAVSYDRIVSVCVKAIQDLKIELDILKEQINKE